MIFEIFLSKCLFRTLPFISVTLDNLINFMPLCLVISMFFSQSIGDPENFLTCKNNIFLSFFKLLYLKVSPDLSLVIGEFLCKPSSETLLAEGSSALSAPFPCPRADGDPSSFFSWSTWVLNLRVSRGCLYRQDMWNVSQVYRRLAVHAPRRSPIFSCSADL